MKLKALSKIEKAVNIIIVILILPFCICGAIIDMLLKLFKWVIDELSYLRFKIGNKLLCISDEANDGTIQNQSAFRCYTAFQAYKILKREKKMEEKNYENKKVVFK